MVPSVATPRARVESVSTSGTSDNIPIDILPHVIREKTGTDRHAAVIASRRRSLSRSRKGNQRRLRSASRKRSTRTQSAAPYARASGGSESGGADDGHLSLTRTSKFAGLFSTAAVAGSSSGGPPVDEWGPSMSRSMSIEDDDVPFGSSAGMHGMSWTFHEAAVKRTSSTARGGGGVVVVCVVCCVCCVLCVCVCDVRCTREFVVFGLTWVVLFES